MKFPRILLYPFSVLFGIITRIRNWMFDAGLIRTYSPPLPVICIGNLSVGGTGKTPHTEYLIRLLKDQFKLSVLSRGYGRKSTGFAYVNASSSAREAGDEPLQIKNKFGKEVLVGVDEVREHGIRKILAEHSDTEIILLDDAFQHRRVKAGLNIVLSDYSSPFYDDYLLPAGNLREARSGTKRADVVIFTKCPPRLEEEEKKKVRNRLPGKSVFFSSIHYAPIRSMKDNRESSLPAGLSGILLFSGIANNKPLKARLEGQTTQLRVCEFPDHRNFSEADIQKMKTSFESMSEKNNIIVTSEKDTMRLRSPQIQKLIEKLPLYYVPISIEFSEDEREQFHQIIYRYVEENKRRG
jgi:tetraacyldisaccharide 4'-kinase